MVGAAAWAGRRSVAAAAWAAVEVWEEVGQVEAEQGGAEPAGSESPTSAGRAAHAPLRHHGCTKSGSKAGLSDFGLDD